MRQIATYLHFLLYDEEGSFMPPNIREADCQGVSKHGEIARGHIRSGVFRIASDSNRVLGGGYGFFVPPEGRKAVGEFVVGPGEIPSELLRLGRRQIVIDLNRLLRGGKGGFVAATLV